MLYVTGEFKFAVEQKDTLILARIMIFIILLLSWYSLQDSPVMDNEDIYGIVTFHLEEGGSMISRSTPSFDRGINQTDRHCLFACLDNLSSHNMCIHLYRKIQVNGIYILYFHLHAHRFIIAPVQSCMSSYIMYDDRLHYISHSFPKCLTLKLRKRCRIYNTICTSYMCEI